MKYGIVHYNTPELTSCLIGSINKYDNNAIFYIVENSTNRPIHTLDVLCNQYILLNNMDGRLIDFNKWVDLSRKYLSPQDFRSHGNSWGSLKHAVSVQYLIDYIKDDFLLLDSDVLLQKSPLDLVGDLICCDFLEGASNSFLRVLPFICYFHYATLVKYNLKFFDITRINACSIATDTGGSFCSDIIQNNISYRRINARDYIVHYGNGSWRGSKLEANLPNTIRGTYFHFLMEYKHLWR